jgi:DNA-binding NarL/FixJ family response regulator
LFSASTTTNGTFCLYFRPEPGHVLALRRRELVAAIRAVHAVIPGCCRGRPGGPPVRRQGPTALADDDAGLLTEREREVLKLVVEGYTSQEIADLLHLSKRTVMCHRANIASKLGIHNRMELLRYAMRIGVIEAA